MDFLVDADEVVTADLSKELLAINFESPHCEGFEVNRKVFLKINGSITVNGFRTGIYVFFAQIPGRWKVKMCMRVLL